jgi:hypothetical protein
VKRLSGEVPLDLGPLGDLTDAMSWLELIGRKVAAGEVSNQTGRVIIRAVEAWSALYSQREAQLGDAATQPASWVDLMALAGEERTPRAAAG